MLQGNILITFCQVCDIMTPPLVDAAMSGFNGTLMAYGQTGSGAYGVLEIYVFTCFRLSNFVLKKMSLYFFHKGTIHVLCTQNFTQNFPPLMCVAVSASKKWSCFECFVHLLNRLFQRYNKNIKTGIEVALRLEPIFFSTEIRHEYTETYGLKTSS